MSSSEGVSLPQLALSTSSWRTQLDRAWQHLLFMIPYASAIMTGLTLHLLTMNDQQNVFLNNHTNSPDSASDTTTIADEGVVDEFSSSSSSSSSTDAASAIPFVLDTTRRTPYIKLVWLGGFIQLMMVGAYLTSGMNNHTLKKYSTGWHTILTIVLTVGMILMNYHHDNDNSNTEDVEGDEFTQKRTQLMMKQALLIQCLLYWFPNMFYMFWIYYVPNINEVIAQKLYIGNAKAATSSTLLKTLGITHILELYEGNLNHANDAYRVPYHVRLLQLECDDTIGSKRSLTQVGDEAISFIHDAIGDDHPSGKASNARVLVHCTAGISRSPAMVCHYLLSTTTSSESSNSSKKKKQQRQKENNTNHLSPIDNIYQQLRIIRPLADVSNEHMMELRQYHSETNKQKSIQTDTQQTSKAIVGNPKRRSKATKNKKIT